MTKTIFFYTIIIFSSIQSLYAQSLGLQWLQRDQLFLSRNPAIPFPKKTVIGLPELQGGLDNSLGFPSPVLNTNSSGLDALWNKMTAEKEYSTNVDWALRSFAFGKKYQSFQWSISHAIQGNAYTSYNKDLVGLLIYGNYGLLDKDATAKNRPLTLKPGLRSSMYQSFSVDAGLKINEKFYVGANLNYLSGFYNVESKINKLDIDIRDPFVVKTEEDWIVQSADLVNELSIDSVSVKRTGYSIGRHSGVSGGVGLYHSTERLHISSQIRDLGLIYWKGIEYSRKGGITYDGVQVQDFLALNDNVFNGIRDTLRQLSTVSKTAADYTTTLAAQWITDIQYAIHAKWMLGAGFALKKLPINNAFKLTVATVFKPSTFVHIGSQVALDQNSNLSVGLFGAVRITIVNLYMHLDHVPVLYDPKNSTRVRASIGMNVMW